MSEFVSHRWSGWPGAWCLDCGLEDQNEICISEHDEILKCVDGHSMCGVHESNKCTIHKNEECKEPGSRRHDPYNTEKK